MRLLVCGGRHFSDREALRQAMNAAVRGQTGIVVIHGGATGADAIADDLARKAGIEVLRFPADWDAHGKRAGYIRNMQMLQEGRPDLVLAAPGGRGTAMMVSLAGAAGVPVMKVK